MYVHVSPFSYHLFPIIKYLLISPPALILAHKIVPASLLPISKNIRFRSVYENLGEKTVGMVYCSECRQRQMAVMVRIVGKTCRSKGRVTFGPV